MFLPHRIAWISTLLAAGLGARAGAQTWVESPASLGGRTGGSANELRNPFSSPESRFQIADGSLRGTPMLIDGLQLRRDENSIVPGAARTTDLRLRLAHCALSQVGSAFDANATSAWTVVYDGPVSLPFTSPATTSWNRLTLPPFQTAFAYDGQRDLLVEFECRNTSRDTTYPLDATDGRPPGIGETIYFAPDSGCQTPSRAFTAWFLAPRTNSSDRAVLAGYATGAPSSAPGALLWGFPNQTSMPGVCGILGVDPIVLGIPAPADALGRIGRPSLPMEFRFPARVGGTVALQFVSVDTAPSTPQLELSDPARLRLESKDSGNPVIMVWSDEARDAPIGRVTTRQVPVMRFRTR